MLLLHLKKKNYIGTDIPKNQQCVTGALFTHIQLKHFIIQLITHLFFYCGTEVIIYNINVILFTFLLFFGYFLVALVFHNLRYHFYLWNLLTSTWTIYIDQKLRVRWEPNHSLYFNVSNSVKIIVHWMVNTSQTPSGVKYNNFVYILLTIFGATFLLWRIQSNVSSIENILEYRWIKST